MIRRPSAVLALLFALLVSPAIAGDDPAVARLALFLDAHGHQSGLPDDDGAESMRPLVSSRLAADLAVAISAQADFVRDHPDEKPPLVEGPLFNSSGYEPYTAYEIVRDPAQPGTAGTAGERRVLRVRFTDDTVTPALTWEDEYALVHEGGAWRVDDVAYRGGFAYGNHGTLRAALYGVEPPHDAATPAAPAAPADGDAPAAPAGSAAPATPDPLVPEGCS